jgi:hypothetical protein
MRLKRKVDAAFRPVLNQTASWPSACASRISASERRITCALKPPARPRSAVTGMIALDGLAPLEQRQAHRARRL